MSDVPAPLPEMWQLLVRADAEALTPAPETKNRVRRRLETTLGITALAATAAGVASTVTAGATAGPVVVSMVKVVVGLIAVSAVTGTAYVGLREKWERREAANPRVLVPAARSRPPPPKLLPDPLAEEEEEEEELLTNARAALVRGALEEASRWLELHRVRFRQGRLSEEREALEIRLLVRSGNVAQGRRRAAAFRASHPDSLQLPVIDEALRGMP